MIYLTILLFVKEGKEDVFEKYESAVLPLMKDFGGEVLYRIRPEKSNYIAAQKELPFEVHLVSFITKEDFEAYLKDTRRQKFMHLKEEAIKTSFIVKGKKL